jgi:hypothetical protein
MELVAAQVKLVRLELHADARNLGARLARVAVFLPLAFLGYALLTGAAVHALTSLIGLGWALVALGAVNALVGGWGLFHATRTLRQVRVLDRSRDELARSLETVTPAAAISAAPVDRT